MKSSVLCWVVSVAAGCTSESTMPMPAPELPESPPPQDPLPQVTGSFAGQYRVPTAAELANAAVFGIDTVDWTISGGVVTLHYNLPTGLVGGHVSISLTGPLDPGSTQVALAGANGRGVCVATATRVTCQEAFVGLGMLPISSTIVEKAAAMDYAGPVADRIAVAGVFSSDPIGSIEIDLTKPVIDDHGKD